MIRPRLRKISIKTFVATGLGWALSAAAGAVAVLLAHARLSPAPTLHDRDFSLDPQALPYTVRGQGLSLPFLFGDFDLYLNVQVDADEFDVVFRKVVPIVTRDEGAEFHGRYSLLRLSTQQAGPPYRTREQALFGDDVDGGMLVTRGYPPWTVIVQARGHAVRANVGGTWLPWIETADDHGHLEFLPRGGTVQLTLLRVLQVPRQAPLPAWLIAAGIALLGALLASLTATSWALRTALFVGLLPLGGWLASVLLLRHLSPWTAPALASGVAVSLLGLPVVLGACVRRWRPLWIVAGLVAGVAALEFAARRERPRLEPLTDPRLSLYFGEASGTAPFDALANRIPNRSANFILEERRGDKARPAILFLGGRAIFDAHADFAQSLGLLASLLAAERLDKKIDGIVLPTAFGNTLQQLLLFRRFYRGFAPHVVVFGLTRFESLPTERRTVRQTLAAVATPAPSMSQLLELHDRMGGGDAPAATPGELLQTLNELQQLSTQMKFRVVLASGSVVAPELLAVFEKVAAERSWPLVRDVLTEDGKPAVDPLMEAIVKVW